MKTQNSIATTICPNTLAGCLRTVCAARLLPLLLFLTLPAVGQAQDYDYTINGDNTITITEYIGSGGDVTIPDTIDGLSVTSIGDYAFFGCQSLTGVTIPSNVTNIGFGSFAYCTNLTTITVATDNPAYRSVAGVLFNKSTTTLIQCPGGKAGSYTIPNSVTSIGYEAFAYCYDLSSVTIHYSVTRLGDLAFYDCDSLTEVYFQGNAPIISVSGPPCCTLAAFANGNNETGYDPTTVYYLPGTSGWGSTFGGVPAVMMNPPSPAGSLQVTITPPAAITAGAQWQVDGGIPQPSGATVLGLSVGNHTVSFSTVSPWTTPANQTVSVSANSTVTATGIYIYTDHTDHSLVLNGDFETGDFTGWTLAGDTSHTFVDDGSESGTPYSGGYEAALGTSGSLGYLSQTLSTAPGASYLLSFWLDNPYADPGEFIVSWNGNTLLDKMNPVADDWTIIQFVVTATGTSTVLQFGFQDDCDYLDLDDISVVPAQPGNLFTFTTNNGTITITGYIGLDGVVTIPDVINGYPVTSIGDWAFDSYHSLTNIMIGNSVTNIGYYAFDWCASLTAITVDTNNPAYSSVGGILFNKSQTTLIQYPGGIVGGYIVSNSVTNIGASAFYYCTDLTSVTIGNSVTSIGDWAFGKCFGLTGVYFVGNAPTNVGDYVFAVLGGPPCCVAVGNETVYYRADTTGWENFALLTGVPTVLWNPQVQNDASFGVLMNQFGFNITGTADIVVVVEACTNLSNPTWFPLQTNTLTGGSSYFSDPDWTNHPGRFYRLRSP